MSPDVLKYYHSSSTKGLEVANCDKWQFPFVRGRKSSYGTHRRFVLWLMPKAL